MNKTRPGIRFIEKSRRFFASCIYAILLITLALAARHICTEHGFSIDSFDIAVLLFLFIAFLTCFLRKMYLLNKAGKALIESEFKFRQLAENIQGVFWIASRTEKKILYLSPFYETIWGRSREEAYREPLSMIDAIHPEDRDKASSVLQTSRDGEYFVFRIIRPDGAVRWLRNKSYPVRNENGEITRIIGIIMDITEIRQERMEREAAEIAAERAKTAAEMLEYMLDPVFITDSEGRIRQFNKAFSKIYGYGADIIGDWPTRLVIAEDIPRVIETMDRCAREGFVANFVCTNITKDGKKILVMSNINVMKHEDGTQRGMIAVIRHIAML